ncbi:hypothetical protein Amet_1381 [Calderihabitans maritimus]|uniref:Thiamin/hydroxymethyl pyrimidine-binding YkoF putative domain-containing protein n=1 Tax=Calderihabitans maritimus TaxID=1246530 RepID=A0A1Z5HR41_9FIRM|nr:YkoF family thiamine/hydroxymethylpyrimidine-binding protein [Calderihabitans maritimus]GAW92002.1 hypothetical protein Amet_1381 [Calderihabitans maritimus]
MLGAEVSLYPLKTSNASSIITEAINSLHGQNLTFTVGSISTEIRGEPEAIWNGLKTMFNKAQQSGEVSMVVTLTNAAD